MNPQSRLMHPLVSASALALIFGLAAAGAQATIILSPDDADATTDDNSNLTTLAAINEAFFSDPNDYYTNLSLLYKANAGGVVTEEGPYATSYTTVFSNTPTDPEDANITWDGPLVIDFCPTCILIVKDGSAEPAQYLFDLGSWDGMEEIELQDFWPNGGAISNVAIWGGESDDNGGGPPQQIPEPGMLFLMGAGLLGLGLARRRKPV